MDSVFGLVGEDFVMVAADAAAARSILVFKHDEDKITPLDSHKVIAASGTPADCVNFVDYINKNMKLYELNNGVNLSTKATANFIRNELATALRKGPYQSNILLAGHDAQDGSTLYTMDMYAALSKINFGAHGYAANFILSVFDRDWRKGMNVEEGIEVIKKCIHELNTRFLISQPVFIVKVIDKNGIRVIKL